MAGGTKGPFTLPLAIAIPMSGFLAITVLLRKWHTYPFLSEILSEDLFFQYGTAIARKQLFDIAIAKASVKSTIDNIQFPLFLGIANANAIAQCERNLTAEFRAKTYYMAIIWPKTA